MRVTIKPSGRVIFFFCCKSCKPAYTTYSEKKKLHDYTVFLLRAFTAKKKLHELQHTPFLQPPPPPSAGVHVTPRPAEQFSGRPATVMSDRCQYPLLRATADFRCPIAGLAEVPGHHWPSDCPSAKAVSWEPLSKTPPPHRRTTPPLNSRKPSPVRPNGRGGTQTRASSGGGSWECGSGGAPTPPLWFGRKCRRCRRS